MGKAAVHPPALAVLSHTPDGATQTIAWVGKGIVYDTGGLSMKGKVRGGRAGSWAGQPLSGPSEEAGRFRGPRAGTSGPRARREATAQPPLRRDLVPSLCTGIRRHEIQGKLQK